MNLRTLKKHCLRAKAILIAEHGYKIDDFKSADGSEAIYAPRTMERRFVRNSFIEPGVLKGTPLLWLRTSYECDEWEAVLTNEVLEEIVFWKKLSEKDAAKLFAIFHNEVVL